LFAHKLKQDNASTVTDYKEQRVEVTHPFSPLYGQELIVCRKIKKRGRDWLVCVEKTGKSTVILGSWTNYPCHDPDRALMQELGLEWADFRYEDLIMLANLLSDIMKM
jgi:hypothetical protein